MFVFAADIYDEVISKELSPKKLESECVGGGRIQHVPSDKTIKVYGYSQVSLNFLSFFGVFRESWADGKIFYAQQ